ncbi:hypothetical protein HU200_039580 [Digitaria exilis]|uniref:Uncharacterized protein n=1 Tax=Digitaria exilis TaxID=1010633 RepID=A0A835BGA5_9POAL|nr:hypothetical protein HU200_039580 [Digitaria exilis]
MGPLTDPKLHGRGAAANPPPASFNPFPNPPTNPPPFWQFFYEKNKQQRVNKRSSQQPSTNSFAAASAAAAHHRPPPSPYHSPTAPIRPSTERKAYLPPPHRFPFSLHPLRRREVCVRACLSLTPLERRSGRSGVGWALVLLIQISRSPPLSMLPHSVYWSIMFFCFFLSVEDRHRKHDGELNVLAVDPCVCRYTTRTVIAIAGIY